MPINMEPPSQIDAAIRCIHVIIAYSIANTSIKLPMF